MNNRILAILLIPATLGLTLAVSPAPILSPVMDALRAQVTQRASMAEVVEAAMQPLEGNPDIIHVNSSGSTAVAAATAVGSAFRSVRYVQELAVENLSSTVHLCIFTVSNGTACSSGSPPTCDTDSTPSIIVPAGKSKKLRFAGTRDVCAVTASSGGKWQVERVLREVGAR